MAKPNVSPILIRERLIYDPVSGIFTWRIARSNILAGTVAGTMCVGYVKIGINKVQYAAHRLAWVYVYDEWPTFEIDHIDGVRTNNAIANLRKATCSQNRQNLKRAHRDSKLGVVGVVRKAGGRYEANICIDFQQMYLGLFDTAEQAHAAYVEAKRRLHPFGTL